MESPARRSSTQGVVRPDPSRCGTDGPICLHIGSPSSDSRTPGPRSGMAAEVIDNDEGMWSRCWLLSPLPGPLPSCVVGRPTGQRLARPANDIGVRLRPGAWSSGRGTVGKRHHRTRGNARSRRRLSPSVDADHDVGRLDDSIGVLADGKLEIVDGGIGYR
jgi:hypothetical protein